MRALFRSPAHEASRLAACGSIRHAGWLVGMYEVDTILCSGFWDALKTFVAWKDSLRFSDAVAGDPGGSSARIAAGY